MPVPGRARGEGRRPRPQAASNHHVAGAVRRGAGGVPDGMRTPCVDGPRRSGSGAFPSRGCDGVRP